MTGQPRWDADFPLIRLNGSGARDFLQGQSTADLRNLVNGVLQRSCWLTATGRLRALLEIRMDDAGADVLVLAGDAEAVARGFDMVIFPADRVRLGEVKTQRRVQALTPDASTAWVDGDGQLPTALSSSVAVGQNALAGEGGTQVMGLGFPDQTIIWDAAAIGSTTRALLEEQGHVVPWRTRDLSNGFDSSLSMQVTDSDKVSEANGFTPIQPLW